jgi:hypothetical protein
MVRRRCFAELGGAYEGLNFAEDHHLFIRLAKRFPVAYIAQPLVKVRIHPSGLHRNVDPRLAERAYLLIIKEVFDDPDLAPYFKPWKSLAYSSFYRRIGDYAYGKDMRLTRHYLREAVRVYPQIMLRADGISVAYLYAKSFLPNKLRQTLGDLKWHFLDSSKRLGE